MKIYVLGSNSFVHDMVASKDRLCELGLDGWIHPDYEDHVNGKGIAFPVNEKGERVEDSEFKKAHDYIRQHYNHILKSDAILIINNDKKGSKNYIGGNCLMEMGVGLHLGKKIFILNPIDETVNYKEEILCMLPTIINGDLESMAKLLK
jgi:hypothetical protein